MRSGYLLSFLFYLIFSIPYSGQDSGKEGIVFSKKISQDFDFIRYDRNKIDAQGNEKIMAPFYQSLNKLVDDQNVQVDIVHIGDSHLQADFFTGRVRDHFHSEKRFGNAGRGYFFPCVLARSNTPHNLDVAFTGTWQGCKCIQTHLSCFWGLSGYTATTNDENAIIEVNSNHFAANAYFSNYVKVYYDVNDPVSYKARIVTPEKTYYPKMISDDFLEFELDQPIEKIKIQLSKTQEKQDHFTLKGISLENEKAGVRYHSVGVNGATIESFLRCNKMESHLQSLNPSLVIISLGANDVFVENFDLIKFKEKYVQLVQKIKSACPNVSLLLCTPYDAFYQNRLNRNNLEARNAILEIAKENNCAVWDIFTIMGGYGSILKWLENDLALEDKLHFSNKGYELQGDLFYDALIEDYAFYYGLDK